jgi:hypothetical protein
MSTYENENHSHLPINMSQMVDAHKYKHVPSVATRERVKAFCLAGFTQEAMARLLDISVDILQQHYPKELAIGEAECLDQIVFVARSLALQGNTEMIKLILKTKGAKHGWVEKQVHEVGVSKELEELSLQLKTLEVDNEREY